jgi:hypothetical protein
MKNDQQWTLVDTLVLQTMSFPLTFVFFFFGFGLFSLQNDAMQAISQIDLSWSWILVHRPWDQFKILDQ